MGRWGGTAEVGAGWRSAGTMRAAAGGGRSRAKTYSIHFAAGSATKLGSGMAVVVGMQIPTSRIYLESGSLRSSGQSQTGC